MDKDGHNPDLSANSQQIICVRCPKGCALVVTLHEDGSVNEVRGHGCKLGIEYAIAEVTDPSRIVTLSLPIANSREPLSVKTAAPVPKSRILAVVEAAKSLNLQAPIQAGIVLDANIADTGVALVATKTLFAEKELL